MSGRSSLPLSRIVAFRAADAPSALCACKVALARCVHRLLVAAAIAVSASPAHARLTVMHGYVDYASALIWIQTDNPGPVDVAWRAGEAEPERWLSLATLASTDNVTVARLGTLTPGTRVSYRISGDGDQVSGTFTSQPRWSRAADAPDIAIAIGSCFFLADENPAWGSQAYGGGYRILDAVAASKPDLMIWMGDYLYFQPQDEFDATSMAARYRRQRAFPPLRRLLTSTSHVAIWDDHDYGPNDADLSYELKGESLALFKRYWPNPSHGLPGAPGVFSRVRYGDVDVFMLDDRWYRSAKALADGPGKAMFGERQLEWLRNALVHSRAAIKLVVNGSQMWNRVDRFEGWNHYAHEQGAFAEWLVAQRIDGVIFASGDRHFGELLKIERGGAYPLYEFTSSPLKSTPFRNPAGELDNPDLVAGTLVSKRQFGIIRVTGPGNDRRIALESRDESGALLWRHELRAQDLRFLHR